ncbi:MAG: type II toxin-antitoxin system HicB family antitoxin [Acidobacteriota bacterium]
MRFTVELEREADGRWIAEVADLPGVMAYGATRDEALGAAEALALRGLEPRYGQGDYGLAGPDGEALAGKGMSWIA